VRFLVGEQVDASRRELGDLLDALGLGPLETPARSNRLGPVTTLKRYTDGAGAGAPLLLVPAPIAPVLSVVDPRSELVPPPAVLPFHAAAGSAEARLVWYRGDTGVALQHVGALVGRTARREVWPAILQWVDRH
jgi:hypothetical protein